MLEPASAIQRQVDDLIQQQIAVLKQPSFLSRSELNEYHARYSKLSSLFEELDRNKPVPPIPVHKSRHQRHLNF